MKNTPFKMNPGFDALPGKVQAKIKGRSPNRFFGGALQRLFGKGSRKGAMGAVQAGRKLMGSNRLTGGALGMLRGAARNIDFNNPAGKQVLMNKLGKGLAMGPRIAARAGRGAASMIGRVIGRRR